MPSLEFICWSRAASVHEGYDHPEVLLSIGNSIAVHTGSIRMAHANMLIGCSADAAGGC